MTVSTALQKSTSTTQLSPSITAQQFAAASRSEATRRAYRSDWADFTSWCSEHGVEALPASPATVGSYLAAQASSGYKPATLSRRLAAINGAHRLAGCDSPTTDEGVRLVMAGIRRKLSTAQTQARPILTQDLRRIVAALPDTLTGLRDRALLLVGFAAALRRSELVALSVEDLEFTDAGVALTISESKTDQEGHGEQIGVPYGSTADACPVTALQNWLQAAQITSGPIFRRVDRHGHIGPNALQSGAVAQIIKKSVEAVGLDASQFSGHSLRSGLATSAAQNGASEIVIMSQTRHKSTAMVKRYVRRGSLFTSNAASAAGL